MPGIVCLGDATTHGGKVITASSTMFINGIQVALVGDMVSCPIPGHGVNPIIEGASTDFEEGVCVVVNNCQSACGSRVITSHPEFWWRLKQAAKQIFYRPHKNGKSESENTPHQPASKNINSDIKSSLQKQYGRFWPRKVRILLLTGSAADVEQLTPGLTSQYWQEDSGTVLLWGGDLGAPADNAWLSALRKLRRRPLDGVVWVTSAFVRQSETKNTLSADMMDNVSQAFATRYEQLGWRLPLYVWSLHPSESTQSERITQSVGCLLPASCKPEEFSVLLAGLVPELIEQGTHQVITRSQHLFLLQLAVPLILRTAVVRFTATCLTPWCSRFVRW